MISQSTTAQATALNASEIFQNVQFPMPFAFQFPWNVEIPQYLLQNTKNSTSDVETSTRCSSATEPTSSSRCSSVESSGKIRRGRPQQDIEDASDLQSQQKKHRRLYARRYRLEMRQKVDQVKTLADENDMLNQQVEKLRAQAEDLKKQLNYANTLLHFMQLPAATYGNSRVI